MAEDFQGSNWWKTSRSGGFDGGSPAVSSISCTTSIADVTGGGPFNWSDTQFEDAKARPGEELTGSIPTSSTTTAGIPIMDSTLQISSFGLSTPSMDWTQTLLSNSGRAGRSFQAMLQEELSSRPSSNFFQQQPTVMDPGESSRIPIKDMNQSNFLLDNSISGEPGFPITSSPSSYEGCSPAAPMLHGLFDSLDTRTQHPFFVDSQQMVDYQSQMFANYRGVSTEMQQLLKAFPQQQQSATSQMQFSNNTRFWNASGSSSQLGVLPFNLKPDGSSNLTMKNSEGVREKKNSNEPPMKKIRMETPSSLPTFKVRKEKLGDRITALQQLVSPFGKTDTASVLHEAIEYIKFLHEQVSVLSTPYLKNGHPAQQQRQHSSDNKSKDGEGPKQDLRSRGLCLVPIASTYPVASDTTSDFWTPTFGGTYR